MKKMNFKATIISCYLAYTTQAIVVNFMPILFIVFQEGYGISFKQLGNLVLLNFLTQIFADIVGTRLVDKIGYRRAAVPAHIFVATGLILLGILPDLLPSPYLGLVISIILFSFGGGLIEVFTSPIVNAIPSSNGSASMSLLHSFYCWGQVATVLVTTVVLKIFGYNSWKLLSICWAVIPIINAFNFYKVRLPETRLEKRQSVRFLLSSKKFIICVFLLFSAGASEIIMSQWSSIFAQKGLGISKLIGDTLGPCVFALFMAAGRVWYGLKGKNVNLKTALLLCGILGVICYFTAGISSSPYLSLAACSLTGFSVSIMWPGIMSYTASSFTRGGAAMFGVMAIFGDMGCSIGPWLTGMISDSVEKSQVFFNIALNRGIEIEQIALKAGILSGIIFPVALVIGIIILKKKNG